MYTRNARNKKLTSKLVVHVVINYVGQSQANPRMLKRKGQMNVAR